MMARFLALSVCFAGAAAHTVGPAPLFRLRGGTAKSPADTYKAFVAGGADKATTDTRVTLMQSVSTGCFVAFGGALLLTVGGQMPGIKAANPGLQKIMLGIFGLPWAMMMIVLTGGQLFTGNTAMLTAALLEKKITLAQLAKNWVITYLGNFVGSLAAMFLLFSAGLFTPGNAAATTIATYKTSIPFMQVVMRGFLCNWMVCIAVFMMTCSASLPGKFLAAFLPISSFVALGFEHSIANMGMIPLGMLCGADVSLSKFLLSSLLPVTIGNILGGALMVGTFYHYAHGTGFTKNTKTY